MLWLYLILADRYKAVLGPYDWFSGWACDHCGFQAQTYVSAYGEGKGNTQQAANVMAYAAVPRSAAQCLAAAPCPACGLVSRSTIYAAQQVSERAARAERRRTSIPLGIAIACLVLGGIPAVIDLGHGPWLLLLVVCVTLVASGSAMVLLTEKITLPILEPRGVWFLLEQGWAPAPTPEAPAIAPIPALWRTAAFIAAGAGILGGVFAGVFFRQSFRTVYVLNSFSDPNAVVVVDGEAREERLGLPKAGEDIGFVDFSVRTSGPHRVVIRTSDGQEYGYDLDPRKTQHGWVLAPNALENDVCIWRTEVVYGSGTPKPNKLLNGAGVGDVVTLERSYTDEFEEPPSVANDKTTKTQLRAFSCRED